MNFILDILQDGFWAAIAAIGFASISNPPKSALAYCAVIAAFGHATRFILLNYGVHIIAASLVASFVIGFIAVLTAPHAKCPPETFSFPAMLPMIPGMYAYRTVEALMMCLAHKNESVFNHYLYLLNYNGLTCVFIVMMMVIGATVPIFIFKRVSFSATK